MAFSYEADRGTYGGDLSLDVAIIGGGISGLYTGWRLRAGQFASDTPFERRPTTHLFELGGRLGGRLLTTFLHGMPHVRCELGGMRYIRAQATPDNPLPGHQMVDNLGKKLGLRPIPFPMGDGNSMYYVRRQRCRVNDIRKGIKIPYNLDAWEQMKTDDDLFPEIIMSVLDGAGISHPRTREEWNEVKQKLKFLGRPTYALGFWNLLSNFLSSEGYLYLQDINGYDSNTMNWNAGEAMQAQIGDFGSSIIYYTFEEGYDALAHGSAQAFCEAGGKIWVENGLISFSRETRNGDEGLKLTFFNNAAGCYWHVFAKNVVLALPRRSLELIDQDNFFFNDRGRRECEKLRPLIQSVIIQPSFKLYLGYTRPWWRDLYPSFRVGRTITDLPTRQVYYFATESEEPGGDKKNFNSLLMASYSDEWASDFWRPLEEDDPSTPNAAGPPRIHGRAQGFIPKFAPKLMVEHAQKQLREIHGDQINIPDPYISTFYDWGDDPYGGGYHAWAGGFQIPRPWDVAKRIRQPFPNVPVHICGEAYSDQQGWVEGALCTSEHILQDYFRMDYPDWMPKGYYFGW